MDEFLLDLKKVRQRARKPLVQFPATNDDNRDPEVAVLSKVKKVRQQARQQIEQSLVTNSDNANRQKVVAVLNKALASELVCVLRYKRHHFMACGAYAEPVAKEFLQHANEEQLHADQLARRITQLQGEPNFNPKGLAKRSHSQYVECDSLDEMIRENLVAERIAVESYTEIIRWLGNHDPITRKLLEDILKKEEEHASELANLLASFAPEKAP